jgi:hypothetical protein
LDEQQRRREERVTLEAGAERHQRGERLAVVVMQLGRRDHRPRRRRDDRSHPAGEGVDQDRRGGRPRALGVDVRAGAVGRDGIDALDHRVRQVGVAVERDGDRRVRAQPRSERPQQPALGIVLAVRDGRAVEHEIHPVDRFVGRRARELDDLLEAPEGERLARGGPRRDGRDDLALRLVEHAPRRRELAQRVARDVRAGREHLRPEVVDRRLAVDERVRLDRKCPDEHARAAHRRRGRRRGVIGECASVAAPTPVVKRFQASDQRSCWHTDRMRERADAARRAAAGHAPGGGSGATADAPVHRVPVAAAVLVALAAVALAAGCGGSSAGARSAAGRTRGAAGLASRVLPGPCAAVARNALAAALDANAASLAAHPFTPPSGVAACRFAAAHTSVVTTIDSAPQAWNVFNRLTVEYGQNVLWAHQGAKAYPVNIPHLGLDADWLPAEHQVITTDGVRLITVTVNGLPAGAPPAPAVAARLARVYLGPLRNPFPNG